MLFKCTVIAVIFTHSFQLHIYLNYFYLGSATFISSSKCLVKSLVWAINNGDISSFYIKRAKFKSYHVGEDKE